MQRQYLLTALIIGIALALFNAPPCSASDFNYSEIRGNVVGFSTTTEVNTLTGTSTLKEVNLSVWSVDRGNEVIRVTCPTDGSALSLLCQNTGHWFDGTTCVSQIATSSCFPGPDGKCTLTYLRTCSSGRGRCFWGWGFLRTANGQTRPHMDMVYTQNETSCTAK